VILKFSSDRVFVIRLRPAPGIDGIRALRLLLKRLLRRFGLVCIDAREEKNKP
jgi:hypothetical protein